MFYKLSEAFPTIGGQPDASRYGALSEAGIGSYLRENFGEEFWLADRRSMARLGDTMRNRTDDGHEKIDIAFEPYVGPSPVLTLAARPYCEEYTGLDYAPASIKLQREWHDPENSMPEHIKNWLDMAAIIHGMGTQSLTIYGFYNSEAVLNTLVQDEPDLEDMLKNWPNLTEAEKRPILDRFVLEADRASNPYWCRDEDFNWDPDKDFRRRYPTKFERADLIEQVDGNDREELIDLRPLEETAGLVVMGSGSFDSIARDPRIGAVASSNPIKLAKKGGGIFWQNTVKADGYPTMYTPEEREAAGFIPMEEGFWTKATLDLVVPSYVTLEPLSPQDLLSRPNESLPVYNESALPGGEELSGYYGTRNPAFRADTHPREPLEALEDTRKAMEVHIGPVTGRCRWSELVDVLRRLEAVHKGFYPGEDVPDAIIGAFAAGADTSHAPPKNAFSVQLHDDVGQGEQDSMTFEAFEQYVAEWANKQAFWTGVPERTQSPLLENHAPNATIRHRGRIDSQQLLMEIMYSEHPELQGGIGYALNGVIAREVRERSRKSWDEPLLVLQGILEGGIENNREIQQYIERQRDVLHRIGEIIKPSDPNIRKEEISRNQSIIRDIIADCIRQLSSEQCTRYEIDITGRTINRSFSESGDSAAYTSHVERYKRDMDALIGDRPFELLQTLAAHIHPKEIKTLLERAKHSAPNRRADISLIETDLDRLNTLNPSSPRIHGTSLIHFR